MCNRYYGAGIFPDNSFSYDVVWLDYPAKNMEDARRIAHEFSNEHGFRWVSLIKELSKPKDEQPGEEPAEYGCEDACRSVLDRFFDHFRMVGLAVGGEHKARGVID